MKPVYVYFSFRHNGKENKMIVASAIYADPNGKQLLALKTDEVIPWEDSNYVKMIQSYANALNYIYSKQTELDKYKIDTVVLMTSNKILHGWIEKGESHGFKEWFKMIHRPFRTGASKEIMLRVSLGELAASDLAYKYCKPELLENKLELTYRGVRIVPKEEVEQQRVVEETSAEPIRLLSIEEILKRDGIANSVDVDGFV